MDALRSPAAPPPKGSARRVARHPRPPYLPAGFSLYELLCGLVIVSVLATLSLGLRPLIQDGRLGAHVNLLVTDLHFARTEALKRGLRVAICRSRTAAACTAGSQWHEGWIVFADDNGNNTLDEAESVLRVQGALSRGITLRYGIYSYLAYTPAGYITRDGTFTFCDERGPRKARGIIINWSGRTRLTTRTSDNKALSCAIPSSS